MVGNGKRRAGSRIEQLQAELVAYGDESLLPQHAIDVHRRVDVDEPILGQDHDLNPAALVKGDEIAAHVIDLPHVGCSGGIARAYALQVVVEMRKVDERQCRRELPLDVLCRFSDPAGRFDRGLWSPEIEERERAERALEFVTQIGRGRVDIRELAAVGGVHRPRRDAEIRGRGTCCTTRTGWRT